MSLPEVSVDSAGEGDWVVVDQQWWRTSLDSVSWSYHLAGTADIQRAVPLSPYSRGDGRCESSRTVPLSDEQGLCGKQSLRVYDEDECIMLNSELIGVKAAVDAIIPYELSVGFYYANRSHSPTQPDFPPPSVALHANATESDVRHGRELWTQSAEKLTGPRPLSEMDMDPDSEESPSSTWPSDLSPLSSSGGLHSSTSTLSSIDLGSLDIPLTPRAASAPNVAVHDSPLTNSVSELRSQISSRLNASASTFVPSFHTPSKSQPTSSDDEPSLPSLQGFTFPSLDRSTSVKITKDDQGFVTEVEVEASKPSTLAQQQKSSSTLLPPFLSEPSSRRKTPASKTRALVDKLRSSAFSQSDKAEWFLSSDRDRFLDIRAKSASISPSPSPLELVDFLKPRLSVSEDGGDARDSDILSLEPDEEGWFSLSPEKAQEQTVEPESIVKSVQTNAHDKAKRAQALFLALNRHRSSPSSGSDTKEDLSSSSHLDGHEDEAMSGSQYTATTQQSSPPPTPADHLAFVVTSRADSRASSSSSKKQSKRSTPFASSQQQHFPPRPLSISIPSTQPTFAPAMPIPSMAPLQYTVPSSQYPHHPGINVVPYMTPHPHSYLGMPTPINHYLQMQMQVQLQLQMQGLVPSPPNLRPTAGGGDWITPGRALPAMAPVTKPGQHHPMSSPESTIW